MSYVRWGEDGSDVYVFQSVSCYVCDGCATTRTALEMIIHLWGHRGRGDRVPEHVFVRLSKDWHKEKESLRCPWWSAPKDAEGD